MAATGTSGKTYSFKAVLLGEGCVGKTSLVLRYCENKFNDKHITTLQVRAPPARAKMAPSPDGSAFIGEKPPRRVAETIRRRWEPSECGCHCCGDP